LGKEYGPKRGGGRSNIKKEERKRDGKGKMRTIREPTTAAKKKDFLWGGKGGMK